MIFKFTLIWCLVCFDVRAEDRRQRTPQRLAGARYCDFGTQKNYNASDLLQCIDKLAMNFPEEEAGRSSNEKSQWFKSPFRELSFGNVFTSLFNDNSLPHQTSSYQPDTVSSYYQSNYPAVSGGTFDPSPGTGLNLFDALSSISRHDDYKCVPRILCEMASGKLPGRSFGKQSSGFLGSLGSNTFMEWLTKIDVAGSSPVLNFARAMILGYSHKGNSASCYRAFPKCPRDPSGLVHYLNNHNGGFFRLFNRIRSGNYRGFEAFNNQQGTDSLRFKKEGIQVPESRITISRNKNKIVFPDQNELHNQRLLNGIPEFPTTFDTSIFQETHSSFFPQEAGNTKSFRFQFPSDARIFSEFSLPDDSINETI